MPTPALATAAPARDRRERQWVPGLNGAEVAFHDYVDPTGLRYPHFLLKCSAHTGCVKTKGIGGVVGEQLGHIGPLAFLHAWLDCEAPLGKTHPRINPSLVAARAFGTAHNDELEALYQRLVA